MFVHRPLFEIRDSVKTQSFVFVSAVIPSTTINTSNQDQMKRAPITESFLREALITAKMSLLKKKYAYLYKYPNSEKFIPASPSVFVVQNLPETACRQPYRTLSHFGFNIPQIVITPAQYYQPATSKENNLDEEKAPVHISSQECSKNLNVEMKFISVKEIQIDESEDCGASGESLAMPLKNRLVFDFVSDPESENVNSKVGGGGTVKRSLKRIYRNSSMSEEEEFDDEGHQKAVACKSTIQEESDQCCHINVNIEIAGFNRADFIDKDLYCEKIANLMQLELAKSNFKLSVSDCKQKILENIKEIGNSLNELKLD